MAHEPAFVLQKENLTAGAPTILKFEKRKTKYAVQKAKAFLAQQEKDRKAIMKEAKKRAEAAMEEAMTRKGYTKVTVKSLLKHKALGLADESLIGLLEQAIQNGSSHAYILTTTVDHLKNLKKHSSRKKD